MDKGTVIWIDNNTKLGLQELAKKNDRSMAGQIRWMVRNALAVLADDDGERPVIKDHIPNPEK
jgi:hypothetical protein